MTTWLLTISSSRNNKKSSYQKNTCIVVCVSRRVFDSCCFRDAQEVKPQQSTEVPKLNNMLEAMLTNNKLNNLIKLNIPRSL